MKYKYMTPENSPFMAELVKIREEFSKEIDQDPIAFMKRVRATAQEFCDEHGLKMQIID